MAIFGQKDPSVEKSLARINSNLVRIADVIEKQFKRDTVASHFNFKFGQAINKQNIKRKVKSMIEKTMSNEQQIKATLSPKTDTGKPAKVDGAPSWTIISGNSQVVVADDGMSADIISSDDPGDTEIMVKADADLGDGIEEISDIIQVHVVGATAKNLGLSLGDPTPKP